jgi:hypothetical protein
VVLGRSGAAGWQNATVEILVADSVWKGEFVLLWGRVDPRCRPAGTALPTIDHGFLTMLRRP